MAINAVHIDVSFADNPLWLPGATHEPCFGSVERYEDVEELIPESDWDELIELETAAGTTMDRLVGLVLHQARTTFCTSFACTKGHVVIQAQQFGLANIVELSPASLYVRVGRPGTGSSCGENMEELCERGILPLDTPENRVKYPHVFPMAEYLRLPAGWEQTAALFLGHEWTRITSLRGFVTALLRKNPVLYGRDGHAILSTRIVREAGRRLFKYLDSYGTARGDGGFLYDSEQKIKRAATYAFALRSTVIQPDRVAA